MHLSCLSIDVGDDLDRPRPGRMWLRDRYRVHQRLCMAFPSDDRRKDDPDFVKSFKPEDFPEYRYLADRNPAQKDAEILKHIHAPRDDKAGLLYRVDQSPGHTEILVQSAIKPDWEYAFHNAKHFLAAEPECKEFAPVFAGGQALRFRLEANPTRRLTKNSTGEDGKRYGEKWAGKRVPVPDVRLPEWLERHATEAGFRFTRNLLTVVTRYIYIKNPEHDGARLRAVRFDGVLTVTDLELFNRALISGIGPGKAFGFGLLSVAPVRQEALAAAS